MPEEDATEQIDQLRASASFCLSLGSKELFHSDFLYWLGGTYPEEMGVIFAPFLKDQSGDCSLAEWPQREKQNIDLQFKFRNGAELVVENKVKSIPSEDQLARYTENQLRQTGARTGPSGVPKQKGEGVQPLQRRVLLPIRNHPHRAENQRSHRLHGERREDNRRIGRAGGSGMGDRMTHAFADKTLTSGNPLRMIE